MPAVWIDLAILAGWLVVLAITAFFSLRYIIRFRQQIARNRAAGMYDGPAFKQQIRKLNILRYGLVGAALLLPLAAIWTLQLGAPPQIAFPIFLAAFLATTIWLSFVDGRWRKLMTQSRE